MVAVLATFIIIFFAGSPLQQPGTHEGTGWEKVDASHVSLQGAGNFGSQPDWS